MKYLFICLLFVHACAHVESTPSQTSETQKVETEKSSVSNAWELDSVKIQVRTGLVVQPDLPPRQPLEELIQVATRSIEARNAEEARLSIERIFTQAQTSTDVLFAEKLNASYREAFPKLKGAFRCVLACEKSKKLLPCANSSTSVAKEFTDDELATRFSIVKVLTEKKVERQMQSFRALKSSCKSHSCVRGQSHLARQVLALENENKEALDFILHEQQQANLLAGVVRKNWSRSPNWEPLCSQETSSTLNCRAIENEKTGVITFTDFSLQSVGDALSPESVKKVNAHYAPAIQTCLTEQAKRLIPPDSQQYNITWVVGNNGLVTESHLRKDLDDTLLSQCVRKQFALWRYPSFTGEIQNVEQSFTVTAVERRMR